MLEFISRLEGRPRVQISFADEGRTLQSSQDECNINLIMSKYAKTGMVDHLSRYGSEYGFASSVDFHEAMNIVAKADQMFSDLPAKARARFGGDPAAFLEFVQDEENFEEAVFLGLADPKLAVEEAPSGGEGAPAAVVTPVVPEQPAVAPEGA